MSPVLSAGIPCRWFIVNPYTVPLEVIQSDDYLKHMKLIVKNEDFQNVMRRFLKGDEGMVVECDLASEASKPKRLPVPYDHRSYRLYAQ